MHMKATRKVAISVILSVLMFSSVTTGAISSYNGPSILNGNSSTISDAFEIPGNTTVIDAWINVDESGYLDDGSGYVLSRSATQCLYRESLKIPYFHLEVR